MKENKADNSGFLGCHTLSTFRGSMRPLSLGSRVSELCLVRRHAAISGTGGTLNVRAR